MQQFITENDRLKYVQFFKSETDRKSYFNGEMTKNINKDKIAKDVAIYLKENEASLKGRIVKLSYFTNEGIVNNHRTISIDDEITSDDIAIITSDPASEKNKTSGDWFNLLTGKRIIGYSIVALKIPKKVVTRKTRDRFSGVFN